MDANFERRGSRPRPFERSSSYSAAIGNSFGNCSVQSSIEIPNIVNTEVYNNEEIKNRYRISQTYVEGKEIVFPCAVNNKPNNNADEVIAYGSNYASSDESDDENALNGLVMKIDIENNTETSTPSTVYRNISNASTQPVTSTTVTGEDIEVEEEIYTSIADANPSNAHGYSTPYTKRRKPSRNG